MNENLLTLKQIADQIGVNYKTIHHYRDVFEEFMKIQFAGRRVKYLPENADLFCKILELKDEGYSNEGIRGILKVSNSESPKVEPSDGPDIDISDGLDICPSISRAISISEGMSDDLTVYISDHLSDGRDIFSSYDLSGGISDPLSGEPSDLLACDLDNLPAEGTDKDIIEQAGGDEDNPAYADSDKDGLAHSRMDVAAQIQAGMDQARKASLKETEALVGSLLTEQAGQLQAILQKMATQSNIAITALCEASEDIRKSILALHTRLSRMEKDLDMKEAEPLELYQVAPENYQVDLPEISPPVLLEQDQDQDQNQDPEDDLAPVKESITDGIPDREKVVEWIITKREKNLQANSYSVLAATLNEAEIPTLTGRANWSKGTIRNLVVRRKTEQA